MAKSNKYIKPIAILFLLAAMWLLFYLASIALRESKNTNLNFIPENCAIVISINGSLLLEEALTTVIFQRQDPEIFSLIQNFSKKDTKENYRLLGINYLSEVVLFSKSIGEHTIRGVLLNLSDARAFENNFQPFLLNNQALYAKSDVGLIITQVPEANSLSLSKNKLNLLAKNILNAPAARNFEKSSITSKKQINAWIDGTTNSFGHSIKYANINTDIQGRSIHINGYLECRESTKLIGPEMTALSPSGIHLSTQLIPRKMNDYVRSFLGDSIPELNGVSINYYGAAISKDSKNPLLPNADVLLQFTDLIVLSDCLASNPKIKTIGQDRFRYGSSEFFFHQFNDSTIYIGTTKYSTLSLTSLSEHAVLTGRIKEITKIEGEGIMLQIFRRTRIFTAFEKLIDGVTDCRVTINGPTEGHLTIDGHIQFNKNINALNALLKLGIRGEFLD